MPMGNPSIIARAARSVLLAGDELLGVEQLAVRAGAHLVDDGRLEVQHHAARHVLARAGLGEESVVRIVFNTDGLVGGHRAVGLDAMLLLLLLLLCRSRGHGRLDLMNVHT